MKYKVSKLWTVCSIYQDIHVMFYKWEIDVIMLELANEDPEVATGGVPSYASSESRHTRKQTANIVTVNMSLAGVLKAWRCLSPERMRQACVQHTGACLLARNLACTCA